jgi:hypothetical protein
MVSALKTSNHQLLSTFASKFNLRHYSTADPSEADYFVVGRLTGLGFMVLGLTDVAGHVIVMRCRLSQGIRLHRPLDDVAVNGPGRY